MRACAGDANSTAARHARTRDHVQLGIPPVYVHSTYRPAGRLAAEMPDLRVGSTFSGHVINGVEGYGGMGVVYRATHLQLDREVALKLITAEFSNDEEFRRRFRREFRATASIQHPNVVPIYHAS